MQVRNVRAGGEREIFERLRELVTEMHTSVRRTPALVKHVRLEDGQ